MTLSLICLNKHTPVPFLSNRRGQQACFYGNPHFFYLSVNPQQLVGILEDPLISSAKKQFCLLIKRLSWLSNFTCRLCKECEHAFILPFIMADPVMGGGVWGHGGQVKIQRAEAVIASLFPHPRVIAYIQYLTASISRESC